MKQIFLFSVLVIFSTSAHAVNFKIKDLDIEIGKKKKDSAPAAAAQPYTCSVEAFGQKFFGEGESEGKARRKATEECQKKYHGMHCDEVSCTKD